MMTSATAYTGRLEFDLTRSIVPICAVDVVIQRDTVSFFIAMQSLAAVDRRGLREWLANPSTVLVVDDLKFWVQSGHLHLTIGSSEPFTVADQFVTDLRARL